MEKEKPGLGSQLLFKFPQTWLWSSIPLSDEKKDLLLDKDERFIGVYTLRRPEDGELLKIDPTKPYATKTFMFAYQNDDELNESISLICDHYNATATFKWDVYKAEPGTRHTLDVKYNTLKDALGEYLTKTLVAPWYETEIRDGSFAAIQDKVVPIYFGDDADIDKIAESLEKMVEHTDTV